MTLVFSATIDSVSTQPLLLSDSAYTERYMGLPGPNGNWKGYDVSDLSAKALQFYGKNFFLIHGTADDNVHFQQSMVLTRALVDHNILFRLQVHKRFGSKICLLASCNDLKCIIVTRTTTTEYRDFLLCKN